MIRAALAGLLALSLPAGAETYPEARRVVSVGGSVTEIVVDEGAWNQP